MEPITIAAFLAGIALGTLVTVIIANASKPPPKRARKPRKPKPDTIPPNAG